MKVCVISTPEEVDTIPFPLSDSILVSQTTFSAQIFDKICANIENNKKIRYLTINFIKDNKALLSKKHGKNNTEKFILKIYFSYFYILIQTLKYVTKILFAKIHEN